MKILFSLSLVGLFFSSNVTAQSANDIISAVKESQRMIKTATYRLIRTDTLVTGHHRIIAGNAKIQTDTLNQVLGFNFQAREDSVNRQMVYNGNMIYVTDDSEQTYQTYIKPERIQFLNQSGGRIIMPDLVKLDTSGSIRMEMSFDEKSYFLKIVYRDLDKYDVRNRYKLVEINNVNMLPMAVRHHQETMGKVQDLYYKIDDIQLNEDDFEYDLTTPPFLKTHVLKTDPTRPKNPFFTLLGETAPEFNLETFDGKRISSADTKGRVILLDFWEVWCGPCIESMPKIQNLYDKYLSKGLQIYAITNDLKQLQSAKGYVEKNTALNFTFLIGNEMVQKDYKLNSFPQYVLIDKTGKVSFVSEGLSPELDEEVRRALGGK
jgi:thiol-disulfide isomerase/thioredoxin